VGAPTQGTPGPGRYPDPGGDAELRYWDGEQWTETVHGARREASEGEKHGAADSDSGTISAQGHNEMAAKGNLRPISRRPSAGCG
jgi:hypothetical protein